MSNTENMYQFGNNVQNEHGNDKVAPLKRETWTHRLDGIITLIGYSVGVGGLLKFPYLCARNGGGAFLIPFLLFTALCALPLFFLELTIGQYYQTGPVRVWALCPAMKGLGLGSVLVSLIYALYSPVYYSWYIYYLVHSFSSTIPWSSCDNSWNTDRCTNTHIDHLASNLTNTSYTHLTNPSLAGNYTKGNDTLGFTTAVEEFWRLNVLDISDGLESPGSLRWPLVGCLTFTFVCMYFILFQGIKVSGKVVYFTFFCPIILLTVLFIRALLLPGAVDGLIYYIKPDFRKLAVPTIWIEACGFALQSLGTCSGAIITVARHNRFKSNCVRDSLMLVFADAFITVYCGFAMFTVLGHLAWVKGVSLDHFQSGGFNIPFMVLPEAVTYLPLPQLWIVVLFVMLITLGLDSTAPCIEVGMATIGDRFPRLSKHRWLLVAMVMMPMFFISILFVTQGGIYWLILTDWYCITPPVLLFGVVQSLVLAWSFGVNRLNKLTTEMYGRRLPVVFTIIMKYVTPALLAVLFAYALYGYRPPKYGEYLFPQWATVIGWFMAVGMIIPFPLWLVYATWKARGDTVIQKVRNAFTPEAIRHEAPDAENTEDSLL